MLPQGARRRLLHGTSDPCVAVGLRVRPRGRRLAPCRPSALMRLRKAVPDSTETVWVSSDGALRVRTTAAEEQAVIDLAADDDAQARAPRKRPRAGGTEGASGSKQQRATHAQGPKQSGRAETKPVLK